MEKEHINVEEIEKVIGAPVQSIERITYGYTNDIYAINGKYILKICVNERNDENFRRASLFCQKYYGRINCPKILYSSLDIDNGNVWQIEEKAKGENLFFKWNKLNAKEKEDVIMKICTELKRIHQIPILEVFERNFEPEEWKNKFKKDISKKIDSLERKGLKFSMLYDKIREYIEQHLNALDETDFRVCHTDMHFDNIMIDDDNNITILDYDRLRIASLDYELNMVNVMEQTPELVVNGELKERINSKDYDSLLNMFKNEYGEMFDFSQMDERLNIYALKHYLGLLGIVSEKDTVINILTQLVEGRKRIKKQDKEEGER